MKEPCDCTCDCGDDPRLKQGTVSPCEPRRRQIVARQTPDAIRVSRGAGPKEVVVVFKQPLDDEQLAVFRYNLGIHR